MAVVSLPLTFNNSFWTQDFRKGLEVLYGKLEQVCLISWAFLVLTGLCAGRRGERRDCRFHHSMLLHGYSLVSTDR